MDHLKEGNTKTSLEKHPLNPRCRVPTNKAQLTWDYNPKLQNTERSNMPWLSDRPSSQTESSMRSQELQKIKLLHRNLSNLELKWF